MFTATRSSPPLQDFISFASTLDSIKTCQETTQKDGFSRREQSLSPKADFLAPSYPWNNHWNSWSFNPWRFVCMNRKKGWVPSRLLHHNEFSFTWQVHQGTPGSSGLQAWRRALAYSATSHFYLSTPGEEWARVATKGNSPSWRWTVSYCGQIWTLLQQTHCWSWGLIFKHQIDINVKKIKGCNVSPVSLLCVVSQWMIDRWTDGWGRRLPGI